MYKVIADRNVKKMLDKIPVVYLSNIKEALKKLESNPRPTGSIKLVGSQNSYRIRVGIYRIIYTIEDKILTVNVVKIDHRSSVYR